MANDFQSGGIVPQAGQVRLHKGETVLPPDESRSRRLLRRLKLDRVDLVPRGANPEANIMLFKNRNDTSASASTVAAIVTSKEKVMSDTELEAKVEELEKQLTDATAERDEAKAKLEETSEAELEAARNRIAELESELEKSDKTDVRKKLDELAAENEKLRKAERRRTFVEKAQTYKDLGDPARIAPLLEEADEHFSEESQKTLVSFLDAASEQVEKGKLFAQLSDPGRESDDWESQLAKAAQERVEKSDGGLTIEQAKTQIMHENAELRDEYLKARS